MRRENSPKALIFALATVAGIAVLGLQACTNGSPTALRKTTESAVMPLTMLFESQQSGVQEMLRLVVRDQATWATVWAELEGSATNSAPTPRIDFSKEIVLVATLGTKPTGGYTISLGPSYQTDQEVTAYVQKEVPGRKCGAAEMVTHPFSVASLTRTSLPVRFVETEEVKECG
jgi:hypothetical protein